ncbi:hypothetical protein N8I77_000218 [Diaporthe amygdali]|uniref:alpha-1,2-Mannosidase n=1 Tax=Phomopsis amygdali TaxID=1214568 RepID=A0AAD9SPK4_PHOAM|nr:hypothetical protein N8I77_000218 [Diaporthe amygdali]
MPVGTTDLTMRSFHVSHLMLLVSLLTSVARSATAFGRNVDSKNTSVQDLDTERAAEIRDAFKFAMDGYFEYAFPNDELRPVNNTGDSNRVYGCGWGLSVVDALDTAIIMELDEIVDRSLKFIDTIDFTRTPTDNACRLFEVNASRLLEQAKSLADTFSYAFSTPTGLPRRNLYLNNQSYEVADDSDLTNPAEAGTLILEWTRLSDLTGLPQYESLARRAEGKLMQPRNPSVGEPFPGLIGISINVLNATFTSSFGGWIGALDSYYEYLIKMYSYAPDRFDSYKQEWVKAAESTIRYLDSHPTTAPEVTWLTEYNITGTNGSRYLIPQSQHLTCFSGGSFILGGVALEEPRYVDYGLELSQGCQQIYKTATKLGPNDWAWLDSKIDNSSGQVRPVPEDQADFYEQTGFFITGQTSAIGAEALESWYYAYLATDDRQWLDYIWDYFVSIQTYLKIGSGYSPILDVNNATLPPESIPPSANATGLLSRYENLQPSFFLAETLKYQYLAHSPDISVGFTNKPGPDGQSWVFNTEAHPVRTTV